MINKELTKQSARVSLVVARKICSGVGLNLLSIQSIPQLAQALRYKSDHLTLYPVKTMRAEHHISITLTCPCQIFPSQVVPLNLAFLLQCRCCNTASRQIELLCSLYRFKLAGGWNAQGGLGTQKPKGFVMAYYKRVRVPASCPLVFQIRNVKDGVGVLKDGADSHGGLFMGVEYIPLHHQLVHFLRLCFRCDFLHYAFCFASKLKVELFHSLLYGSKISHLYITGLSFHRVFTQGLSRLACCLLDAYKAKILLRLLGCMTPKSLVSIVSRYVVLFCSHLCEYKLKAINIVMGVKHPPLHSLTCHFYSSPYKYLWDEPLKKNSSFANLSFMLIVTSCNKSASRIASLPPFERRCKDERHSY